MYKHTAHRTSYYWLKPIIDYQRYDTNYVVGQKKYWMSRSRNIPFENDSKRRVCHKALYTYKIIQHFVCLLLNVKNLFPRKRVQSRKGIIRVVSLKLKYHLMSMKLAWSQRAQWEDSNEGSTTSRKLVEGKILQFLGNKNTYFLDITFL